MITREITYTTFEGEEVTEEFMFHLTESEIVTLTARYIKEGDLSKAVQGYIKSKQYEKIVALFRELIEMSYGRRKGIGFIKPKEETEIFMGSPAYEALFRQLFNQEDPGGEYALDFLIGLLPTRKDLTHDQIKAQIRKG